MSILSILAEDRRLITYRPSLRAIGKTVVGTIVLQQIIYWADKKKGEKFYKFGSPCSNALYNEGDSWEEEVGISAKELSTALKQFAFKLGSKSKKACADKGLDYAEERESHVVTYYTDANRVTWYMLNADLLSKLLVGVYKVNDQQEFTNQYTENNKSDIKEVSEESADLDNKPAEKEKAETTPLPPSAPKSSQDAKKPGQRGYDPKIAHTFSEDNSDYQCATIIANKLIDGATEAYGKKLIGKPSTSAGHIISLFKDGVTAIECYKTVKWLYGVNAKSEYPFRVESGESLRKKWNKIQLSMAKKSSPNESWGTL